MPELTIDIREKDPITINCSRKPTPLGVGGMLQ